MAFSLTMGRFAAIIAAIRCNFVTNRVRFVNYSPKRSARVIRQEEGFRGVRARKATV